MKTIQPNTTITAVSICDSNCIFSAYVISRKNNMVTLELDGSIIKKKVKIDSNGDEYVMAMGTYSMAPVFN
jgi:hypothetical protein